MFDFLNFSLFKTRIEGMGYKYSFFDFFKGFLFYSLLIIVCAYFHKLQWPYIVFIIVIFAMMLPISIYSQYKYVYEQKKFQELCTYLKQIKINFKTHKKVLRALQETREVFTEKDFMSKYIDQAIEAIENGTGLRDSLDIIEREYKNSYITNIHMYMILAETEGGESVYQALDNVDYESWQTDTYIQQTQKFKIQGQNAYYTVGMLILSIITFSKCMPQDMMVDVYESFTYQLYTFFYILVDLIAFIAVKTLIAGKWINEKE